MPLINERTERRHGLEVAMKRCRAHPDGGGQPLDAHRFMRVCADRCDGRPDLIEARVLLHDLTKRAAHLPLQQAVTKLALEWNGEHGDVVRAGQQAHKTVERLQDGGVGSGGCEGRCAGLGAIGHIEQQTRNYTRIEAELQADIGSFGRGVGHLARKRQADRGDGAATRREIQCPAADHQPLGSLQQDVELRLEHRRRRIGERVAGP